MANISSYHAWLNAQDTRLRDAILAVDDEYVTGRWGSRGQRGELEYRLWATSKTSFDEFLNLYKALRLYVNSDASSDDIENDAARYWNMMTSAYNLACYEIQEIAAQATKAKEGETLAKK